MARGNGAATTPINEEIAIERELPCRLTDDELRMRGDAMAEAELAVDLLKDERRALNKKILAHTDARNHLAHVIEAEVEPRMVVCKWIPSFEENVFRLVRQDTGEVVEQRPMSAADRQGSLPIDPDADPDVGTDDDAGDDVVGGEHDAGEDDPDVDDYAPPPRRITTTSTTKLKPLAKAKDKRRSGKSPAPRAPRKSSKGQKSKRLDA